MQRVLLSLLSILFLCGTAIAEDFDLQDWLKRPGVRAVAVEFYASWCGPCQKAMPRFKALKDKFGKEGLRIVVVNTQEPPGKITRLDWTPDAFISDPDGQIAEQFGVGSSLPSAFVWSWNGQLLVRHGHITEVEGAVERILKDLPRVALDVAPAVDDSVVEALKSRLLDSGKVVVVASDAERAKVQAEKIKRARDDMADDGKKCELGREVPPNALLKVATVGKASQLGLTLIDLESGCQKASVQVPYDILTPREVQRTSLDAVEALLTKLRVPFERPTAEATASTKGRTSEAKATKSSPSTPLPTSTARVGKPGKIEVTANESGAEIAIDGFAQSETTGRKAVLLDAGPGLHQVVVRKSGMLEVVQFVSVTAGQIAPVKVTLQREKQAPVLVSEGDPQSFVAVTSNPPGAVVSLDGVPVARAPDTIVAPPGSHTIRLSKEWHAPVEVSVKLKADDPTTIKETLRPLAGSLEVQVDPNQARVLLDGVELGRGSQKIDKVLEGPHTLKASLDTFYDATSEVVVTAGQAATARLQLKSSIGTLRITTVPPGATVLLDGARVGRSPLTVPKLPGGKHVLRVEMDQFQTIEEPVQVVEGETVDRTLELESTVAAVDIDATAPAAVSIDGADEGKAPLSMKLAEGKHVVRISGDPLRVRPWEQTVTVQRGKALSIHADLAPVLVKLNVLTSPPGATVYLDGEAMGPSPQQLPRVPGGPHEIAVQMDGYRTDVQRVELGAKESQMLSFVLKPGTSTPVAKPIEPELSMPLEPKRPAPALFAEKPKEEKTSSKTAILLARFPRWALWGTVVSGVATATAGGLSWMAASTAADKWSAYGATANDPAAIHAEYVSARNEAVLYQTVAIGAAVSTVGFGVAAWLLRDKAPVEVQAQVSGGGGSVGVRGAF